LFNKTKVEKISNEILGVFPDFGKKEFENAVLAGFPQRELKERISWVRLCLKKQLPQDYREAVSLLIESLPEPCDPNLSDNDFGDFIYAPYADFVAQYGCTIENLIFSLGALKEMTTRFSAEDAIRYFINAFPEETMKALLKWSKDAHYHVRRLSSEGSRPKLPWAQKIYIPIEESLPILDNLFYDPTRFVTRSVANHINDISKIDSELAISTLTKWKKSGIQNPKETDFIIRHSLRTLVKQGNPKAIELLGIDPNPTVAILDFKISEKVDMDAHMDFSFSFKTEEDTTIIADYILHFQNRSGQMNSKKVFKLKTFDVRKGNLITLSKKHFLKQFMTTRTLYPGRHEIELQINGKVLAKKSFELILPQRPNANLAP
jgi:3-methyladenine DNA glycosylase AlkC